MRAALPPPCACAAVAADGRLGEMTRTDDSDRCAAVASCAMGPAVEIRMQAGVVERPGAFGSMRCVSAGAAPLGPGIRERGSTRGRFCAPALSRCVPQNAAPLGPAHGGSGPGRVASAQEQPPWGRRPRRLGLEPPGATVRVFEALVVRFGPGIRERARRARAGGPPRCGRTHPSRQPAGPRARARLRVDDTESDSWPATPPARAPAESRPPRSRTRT